MKLTHDRRVVLLAALAVAPAALVSLALLWTGAISDRMRWTLTAAIVVGALLFLNALWERVVRPLQTVSNLLAAMREEDFSIRARGARGNDPLGEVLLEVNALADTLRSQRLGALEATALLSRVMAEIDVAVFAFDEQGELQLTNRAGERLLGQPAPRLLGLRAGGARAGGVPSGRDARGSSTPRSRAGAGRWEVRRSSFRQGGRPAPPARARRRLAAASRRGAPGLAAAHPRPRPRAEQLARADPVDRRQPVLAAPRERTPPDDWREDAERGLAVIASRAEALSRFTGAYARLAKLPPPRFARVELAGAGRSHRGARDARPVRSRRTADRDLGRPRPARAAADQSRAQRRRRGSRDPRRRHGRWWAANGPPVEIAVDDEGPGLRTRRISSCRSSRRNRRDPASGSSCHGRSPKPTAAP